MPKQSPKQQETVERVMHEYKHHELALPNGRKVKNPRQAMAIALREAGASDFQSKAENKQALARTTAKEKVGKTGLDRAEGGPKTRLRRGSETSGATKAALYAEARRRAVPNRSKMTRDELARALSL